MNKDLRKRLEEAARKIEDDIVKEDPQEIYCNAINKGARWGIEWGYKEAIEQAKEWIRDRNRHACQEWLDKECNDFERDMNKIWEEKI